MVDNVHQEQFLFDKYRVFLTLSKEQIMLYYVPMQFIGFYSWYNNRSESDEKKVQSSRMTLKTLIITLLITVALTFALWLILSKMEDSSPWLDSISTILSMVAMFMRRPYGRSPP